MDRRRRIERNMTKEGSSSQSRGQQQRAANSSSTRKSEVGTIGRYLSAAAAESSHTAVGSRAVCIASITAAAEVEIYYMALA